MANQVNKNQAIHTFSKGMNRDLDYTLRSNDMYYDAENLRLTTSSGSDNKVLKNINDILTVGLDSYITTGIVIGLQAIRNIAVVFVSYNTTYGRIYRITFNEETGLITACVLLYDDALNGSGGSLGFTSSLKVKTVLRYETDTLIKAYWTDTTTTTKVANIADYITVNGGAYVITTNNYKAVNKLEFTPNTTFTELELDSIITGTLSSGVIQYAYQFYDVNGTESLFSQLTQPIPITTASYNKATDSFFYGDIPETPSYVGFKLSLVNTNTGFTNIRLVAVFYETLNGTPTIRIADERQISTSASTIYMYDTGETLGEYTLEELVIASSNVFICKDLEDKDNMLFASNITETYFDIGTWDSRAYRFSGADSGDTTAHNYNNSIVRSSRIYDTTGKYYQGSGATPTGTWTGNGGLSNVTGWANIPATFDCINNFNDPTNDTSLAYRFMYKADGATIGGEGPNVSYTFTTEQLYLDKEATPSTSNTYAISESGITGIVTNGEDSYANYASPFITSKLKGFTRDEVYRFGIVFFDNKGNASFVSWVADIRMPAQVDDASLASLSITKNFTDIETAGNVLYPVFTITNPPTGAVGYKIVYVKREFADRSILGQGLVLYNQYDGGLTMHYPEVFGTPLAATNRIYRFISPEISYNANLTFLDGDYFQAISRFSTTIGDFHYRQSTNTPIGYNRYKIAHLIKPLNVYGNTNPHNVGALYHRLSITDGKIVGIEDTAYSIGALRYNPYYPTSSSFYGGTSFVWTTDSGTRLTNWEPITEAATYAYLVNYKRNVNVARFGGLSYNDRSLNQYISASGYTLINASANCVFGDTFICYADLLNLVIDLTKDTTPLGSNTGFESIHIPVETSINIPYSTGIGIHRALKKGVTNYQLTQETAGTWTDGQAVPANELIQDYDLYEYNSVYSQQNIVNTFYSKPSDFVVTVNYDCRVKNSEVKTNNESVDSWTKFPVNDFIEVNTKYGPINNLITFNNQLLYFQTNAFGALSVNPRSLIQDNNLGALVLGTGGVLDRYDYISESVGNTNRFGIAKSLYGLYWLDNSRREVYKFSNSLEPLGYTKGIKSHLSKFDYISNVTTAWDKNLSEILITIEGYITGDVSSSTESTPNGTAVIGFNKLDLFRDTDNTAFPCNVNSAIANNAVTNAYTATLTYPSSVTVTGNTVSIVQGASAKLYFRQTLSFSEQDDCFNGFFSNTPTFYLTTQNKLYSVYSGAIHMGINNKGSKLNSRLSIITGENPLYTKTFDNISLHSRTTGTTGIDQHDSSFTSFRVLNSYQNTDWQSLAYKTNMERRDRHFSFAIPRNRLFRDMYPSTYNILDPANLSATTLFKERIRDKYCRVDFKHAVSNNEEFSVSYIINKYRLSYR